MQKVLLLSCLLEYFRKCRFMPSRLYPSAAAF